MIQVALLLLAAVMFSLVITFYFVSKKKTRKNGLKESLIQTYKRNDIMNNPIYKKTTFTNQDLPNTRHEQELNILLQEANDEFREFVGKK